MNNITVKFKVGDKVYVQFSNYDLDAVDGGPNIKLNSIQGQGDMYDSMASFELTNEDLGSPNVMWNNCWHNCKYGNETIEHTGKIHQALFIPEGITSITPQMFALYFSKDIANDIGIVSIATTVKNVGYEAFKHVHVFESSKDDTLYMDKLERVIFRGTEPLENLGENAFEGCVNLISVDFKGKTPAILGAGIFRNCFKLCTVNFGNNIDLPDSLFENCVSLYSFNATNSINSIKWITNTTSKRGLFNGCTSLSRFAFTKTAMFLENTEQSWFSRLMTTEHDYLTEEQAGYLASLDALNEYIKTLDVETIIKETRPYINTKYEPFDVFIRAYLINYKLATIVQSENGGAFMHKWYTLEHRNVAVKCGTPFLLVKHLGKLIKLNMYPYPYYNMPTAQATKPYIFIKHKDNIWCLARGGATAEMHSPVSIKHDGGLDQIDYKNAGEN